MNDQGRKELAEQFSVMMQMSAWKYFETQILNRIEEQATKDEDSIPIYDLDHSIGKLGECRGMRAAVEKIRTDIEYILTGPR